MDQNKSAPVLAIAIESAEHSLVRRMIEQDELPVMKSLLSAGRWIHLESPAAIGTSSVWPTFMTGEEPQVHGIYSEWCWEPSTMNISVLDGGGVEPFWKALADAGKSVGILAIPFMPFVGISDGFEISESEPLFGPDHQRPPHVNAEVAREALTHGRVSVSGPEDFQNLQKLASDSFEGIKLRGKLAGELLARTRPDLSVIVFTETHESGHCLWQTVEPEHPLFHEDFLNRLNDIRPTLKTIYQEVDRQIGKLIDTVGQEASVLVFALHGLRPARGVPTFLAPLMSEAGFSPLAKLDKQSLTERAMRLAATVKRRTPAGLKKLYYRTLPRSTVLKLASPTLLPQYDWSQTRAFSLVTEQHGSIRINLIGREAKGIVPVDEYARVCGEVEQWLHTLRTIDGKRLAKKVIRMAESGEQALEWRIPDVIVHWEDVAFRSPLQIEGSPLKFFPDGNRYLSQHTSEGFCILKDGNDPGVDEVMPIKDLGRLIAGMFSAASSHT
jgi:predicted AlkP superfamily phosphohydrolase/phosphomutase